MSNKIIFLFGLFFLMSFGQAHAAETKFIFPVSCTYGSDCWAVKFVDVDPAQGEIKDFKCNRKSDDDHKGTDFALSNIAQMRGGVDVLAAADGKILRFRDGESDVLKDEDAFQALKESRKECGNGVLIDHGDGLQTIYCHLKKDSIVVDRGQKIKAGQKIAQVGQSGLAEFPHLHFGVLWEGGIVDPYTGELNTQGCGQMKQSMWHMGLPLEYESVVIFDGGFRANVPDFENIKRGEENPKKIGLNSAAFVFWVGLFNVEEGDVVTLRILDPDGEIFNQRVETVPETRARHYYFAGRKIGRVQLKSGKYTATARIERKDTNTGEAIVREKNFSVDVL